MLKSNHMNLRAKGGSTVLMFKDLQEDLSHSCVVLAVGPKTKYKNGHIDRNGRKSFRPVTIGIIGGDLAGRTLDTYDNTIDGKLDRNINKDEVKEFHKDPSKEKKFPTLQEVVVTLWDDDGFAAVSSRKSKSFVVS